MSICVAEASGSSEEEDDDDESNGFSRLPNKSAHG